MYSQHPFQSQVSAGKTPHVHSGRHAGLRGVWTNALTCHLHFRCFPGPCCSQSPSRRALRATTPSCPEAMCAGPRPRRQTDSGQPTHPPAGCSGSQVGSVTSSFQRRMEIPYCHRFHARAGVWCGEVIPSRVVWSWWCRHGAGRVTAEARMAPKEPESEVGPGTSHLRAQNSHER